MQDILGYISLSPYWRQILRDTPAFSPIILETADLAQFDCHLAHICQRNRLSFGVYLTEFDPVNSHECLILVYANDSFYSHLCAVSFNNLDYL